MSDSTWVLYFVIASLCSWEAKSLPSCTVCSVPCPCQNGPLLNCSSTGLTKIPTRIPKGVTALDLSHNVLSSLAPFGSGRKDLRRVQHLWVGNNYLEHLSLCVGRNVWDTVRLSEGRRCVSWAPALQLLSAERNQLLTLPKGLNSTKSLQVLQLSYNKITAIGPDDLDGCPSLIELHLQHNLISSIHPLAFKHLKQLQVLDLRFNKLITIPTPAYLSLRHLNTLVEVTGNRWRCDCNLKSIKQWITFDRDQSRPTWRVVCASPSQYIGKDLLDLEDSDLTCPTTEHITPVHDQLMQVEEGMEILLRCSTQKQDSVRARWWTPHGQVSENQDELLISGITEQDTGFYVCVSGPKEENISVFYLHVHKRGRETRSRREAIWNTPSEEEKVLNNRNVSETKQLRTQSEFALAVTLSVFITFIVAFILGVLLRPLLDKLCRRIRNRRNSTRSQANSTASPTQPKPYVNEGYSETDGPDQEVREGSRVTFGEVSVAGEQGANMPYYVTVENTRSNSSSESDSECEVTYENVQRNESLQSPGEVEKPLNAAPRENRQIKSKDMECEPIQDGAMVDKNSISSASSISSKDGEPPSSGHMKEAFGQNVDSTTIPVYQNINKKSPERPNRHGPSSELQVQHVNDANLLDPDTWNDSGDTFSFTEGSARSSSHDFSGSSLASPVKEYDVRIPVKGTPSAEPLYSEVNDSNKSSSRTSSESGESDAGQTEYTVNRAEDEPETLNVYSAGTITMNSSSDNYGELTPNPPQDIETRSRQDTITLDPSDIHLTFIQGDSFDDESYSDHQGGIYKNDEIFSVGKTGVEVPLRVHSDNSESSSSASDNEEAPRQYHVHPVYRTYQKGFLANRSEQSESSSSEDEKQSIKHPFYQKKLDIKAETEINRGSTAESMPNRNRILNLNFDNSSSSTDVGFEKSTVEQRGNFRGLSGLRTLVLNRQQMENEVRGDHPLPQISTTNNTEGTKLGQLTSPSFDRLSSSPPDHGSTTSESEPGSDVDLPPEYRERLWFQKAMKISVDPLPRPKRYLVFSRSDQLPLTKSWAPPPPKRRPKADIESVPVPRKYSLSSSSEDDYPPTKNLTQAVGTHQKSIGLTLEQQTRPKKSLLFTKYDSQSQTQSPLSPTPKGEIILDVKAKSESRRSSSSSSSEDGEKHTDDTNLGSSADSSFNRLSKPKRSPFFSTSYSKPKTQPPPPPLDHRNTISKSELKSDVALSSENTEGLWFPGSLKISLDPLPRPKRYLVFSRSDPLPLTKSRAPPPPKRRPKADIESVPVPRKYSLSSSSEDDPSPTKNLTQAEKTHQELNQSNLYSSTTDTVGQSSNGNDLAGEIDLTLGQQTRPKKSLLFYKYDSQSQTQSPLSPTPKGEIILDVKAKSESRRSSSSSSSEDGEKHTDDTNLGSSADSSFNRLSKPKRSPFFSTSYSKPKTQPPPPPLDHRNTISKTELKSDVALSSENTEGLWFPGSLKISLDPLPRPKRYLVFSRADPQPLTKSRAPSPPKRRPKADIESVPVPRKYSLSSSSEDDPSPTKNLTQAEKTHQELKQSNLYSSTTDTVGQSSNGNDLAGEIGLTLGQQTRPKKSLLFSKYDSQSQTQSPLSPTPKGEIILDVKAKSESRRSSSSSSSEDGEKHTDDTNLGSSADSSFNRLSKPKRSPFFSTSYSKPKTQPPPPPLDHRNTISKSELKSDVALSSENTEGLWFPGSLKISLDPLPRPKRYLVFSRSDPLPLTKSRAPPPPKRRPKADIESVPVPRKYSLSSSSEDDPSPTKNLTQAEKTHQELNQSNLYSSTTDTVGQSSNGNDLAGEIDLTLGQQTRPKKSLLFYKYDSQSQTQSPLSPTPKGEIILDVKAKSESRRSSSSSSSEDGEKHTDDTNLGSSADSSFNRLSKPKRSPFFSTSYSKPKTQPPPPPLDHRNTISKSELKSDVALSSENTEGLRFPGSLKISLDPLPRPKRYLVFSRSDPLPLTKSQAPSPPKRRPKADIESVPVPRKYSLSSSSEDDPSPTKAQYTQAETAHQELNQSNLYSSTKGSLRPSTYGKWSGLPISTQPKTEQSLLFSTPDPKSFQPNLGGGFAGQTGLSFDTQTHSQSHASLLPKSVSQPEANVLASQRHRISSSSSDSSAEGDLKKSSVQLSVSETSLQVSNSYHLHSSQSSYPIPTQYNLAPRVTSTKLSGALKPSSEFEETPDEMRRAAQSRQRRRALSQQRRRAVDGFSGVSQLLSQEFNKESN